MPTITVIGAGSWGTALASQLADAGNIVNLWSWKETHNKLMIKERKNSKYFPEYIFNKNLNAVTDLKKSIIASDYILIASPSDGFEDNLKMIAPQIKTQIIISATKGLCHKRHMLLNEIAKEILPNNEFAVIAGPSFAKEVVKKLPTAVLIASNNHSIAKKIQQIFNFNNFRCYTSDDIVGTQIGGAVKNIIAIAAGISDGLGYGSNAQAGIITRGLKEMSKLGVCMGAKSETFAGLSGLGDLVLTATDNQSRNRRFGFLLGQKNTIKESLEKVQQVVEGIATTKAVLELSKKHNIDMPIVKIMYQILYENLDPEKGVKILIQRDVKSETE